MRLLGAAGILSAALAALASGALAHVTVTPGFLAAGGSETLQLGVPNERDLPMTAFELTGSRGIRFVEALPSPPWEATLDGERARWEGGSVAAGSVMVFLLEVEGPDAPGAVQLVARQLYGDGEDVEWPVAMTVVPGDEPSQQLGLALVVLVVGFFLTVGVVALAWRRNARSRSGV